MNQQKINFLKKDFPEMLRKLSAEQKGNWGKMNAQQMVEHITDTLRVTNGKKFQKKELTPEQTEKARSFFLSDKPFRENTTNHLLPEIPYACTNSNITEAIKEMEAELGEFFSKFENNTNQKSVNPFAGEFNFDEWVHLLHKHFLHHAKQFSLID